MISKRPSPTDHSAYFSRYIDLVPEEDILAAMENQGIETQKLLTRVEESRGDYRYAPEKWSIKQVIGHIDDCERVFAYRALTVARGDQTPLPGFDENVFMTNAPFEGASLRHRADCLAKVRVTTIDLFHEMPSDAWDRASVVNGNRTSARAIAYIIVGHERHHVRILRERYAIGT